MKALIPKQTGAPASDQALKGMFEDVAPQCKDHYGHRRPGPREPQSPV